MGWFTWGKWLLAKDWLGLYQQLWKIDLKVRWVTIELIPVYHHSPINNIVNMILEVMITFCSACFLYS